MRRREYIAGVGAAGIGGLAAGAGASRRPDAIERRAPDDEVSVAPGTTVLFEAAVPEDVEPTAVEWKVPEELGGGPLMGDLQYATGDATFSATFEELGAYEIAADHDGETVGWTVTVDEGGAPAPSVDSLSTDPGPDATVGVTDGIVVSADVADAEERLDRVIWVEGRNYTVVEIADVEGERDASTLELDETPHWIDFGYPTVAHAVTADGRLSEAASADGPTVRKPFDVTIVDTNAPVEAGDRLEVEVHLENVGDMMMVGPNEQDISLVVGDEVVDAESVALDWADETTITLGYETYPVEQDVEFAVRAEGADDADETTVAVHAADGTGDVGVSITGTNDPVSAGNRLEVTAAVANDSGRDVEEDLELVVGDEVVDTATVSVAAGGTATTTLGYRTYEVERDVEFVVTVSGSADEDSVGVAVHADDGDPGDGEGALNVSIAGTNAPVDGGEYLEVRTSVGNNGPGSASGQIRLLVGGDEVDSQHLELPAEATETIALGYETYPVATDVTVDLVVASPDDSASTTARVHGTD